MVGAAGCVGPVVYVCRVGVCAFGHVVACKTDWSDERVAWCVDVKLRGLGARLRVALYICGFASSNMAKCVDCV